MCLQHAGDREGNAIPAAPVLLELPAAGRRQRVVLGIAVVFARAPFRLQFAILFEPIQRWKQRAGIDLKVIVAERSEPPGDAVAVHRFAGKDREDHQVKRSLRNVELVQSIRVTPGHGVAPLGCQDDASILAGDI
jgi:hypothetical protein